MHQTRRDFLKAGIGCALAGTAVSVHAAESTPVGGGTVAEGSGLEQGQTVIVGIDAPDPATVEGQLVALDDANITVSRTDSRAGEVHVHFPRLGMTLQPK